jgi:hypothetical protein
MDMKWCALVPGLAVIVTVASGCATTPFRAYSGPELPLEQVSVIRAQRSDFWFLNGSEAYAIWAVDGKSLGSFWRESPREVHVLPGKHVVVCEATDEELCSIYLFPSCLRPPFTFSTEPGKTYVFRCQRDGSVAVWHKFWMESLPASNVVAGPIYHAPGLRFDQFPTNHPSPYAFEEKGKALDAAPAGEKKSE